MSINGGVPVPVVNRWKRYGKDRLYVTLPPTIEGGEPVKVGWYDLATNEPHPETPAHTNLLMDAVEGWKTVQPTAAREEAPLTVEDVVRPAPVTDGTPWWDLAQNRPGQAAREVALNKHAQAPLRSTIARFLGVRNDERAWRIGADGEELVAAQIEKARRREPRWCALHAIPIGDRGSDIDHLLIGPGGIFTINAKHHPRAKIWVGGNTFLVDGHKQPYVRNSRFEATRAATLLTAACGIPVTVTGLIVTVNAADIVIKYQPDGVWVTYRNNVAKWMLGLGPILTDEVIHHVYDRARRSTTWTQ